MHGSTAFGHWAPQLVQCTSALPRGSGQCKSCNALHDCPGALGSGIPAISGSESLAMHCLTTYGLWASPLVQFTASVRGGSGRSNSCNALPQCLGAVGSGIFAMHCLTVWGQWAVEFVQRWEVQFLECTALGPGGTGQCNSSNARRHRLGVVGCRSPATVGSATPAIRCLAAWGLWAMQLVQCTAWHALPHCLGAVRIGIGAMHCLTALGQ